MDPLTTHALFEHARVAEGYAASRPFLHPVIFERVAALVGAERPLRCALDVGCGTGMSTVAMLGFVETVVGADASLAMLRRAGRAAGVRYVASRAEGLPFRDASFDLVAACGSIDWIDRSLFLPSVAGLLRGDGVFVSLDFGDRGRSASVPGLQGWYRETFLKAYPVPPARDPIVTPEEAQQYGFGAPSFHDFESSWSFTSRQYAAFLLTESAVIAAVEYGQQTSEDVRARLEAELLPLFGAEPRELEFSGYIQILRRR